MDINAKKWHLAGFVFTIIAGSLGHFVYQWSGESIILAPFFPVNESTWEHFKLLAFPVLLFSIAEHLGYKKTASNFLAARTCSVLIGMATIALLFYSYTAFTGQDWLWADICIFVLAVALTYFLSFLFLKHSLFSGMGWEITARIFLAILVVSFILFTVQPPHMFLFQCPVTEQYGI